MVTYKVTYMDSLKAKGSVDSGKWDGLSTTPLLTTNLACHDGFELLMTLLVVLVVVAPMALAVLSLLLFLYLLTQFLFSSFEIINVLKVKWIL